MPTSSVALCTCNGEEFLAEQLDSIVAQTVIPDEIVLYDDASEDRTVEIARRYEKKLPLRIIVNPQRLGTSGNFSSAIAACSGSVIFLCDQDDLWEPRKVEKILEIFSGPKRPGLVFSNAGLIDRYSRPLAGSLWQANRFFPDRRQKFENGMALAHLLRSNIVTGATAAFAAEFKSSILPIPANWMHDYWIATVLAAMTSLHCEPALLTRYRIHSSQQVGIHRNPFDKACSLIWKNKNRDIEREKYIELHKRLGSGDVQHAVADDRMQLIDRKLAHVEMRRRIALHFGYTPQLVKEIMNGNYVRFSFGWIDVLADIILTLRSGK